MSGMVDIEQSIASSSAGTDGPRSRRIRPVLWWATIGVAAIAMQFCVYGAWVTSDGFVPSPLGSDPLPT
jgi:hypothetical protein